MTGNNQELALYLELRKKGLSARAAAVVLGHGKEESGNECNRLQGDFSADRARSIAYTNDVDSGRITRDDFVFHGPSGGGYGWLQWTFWARKAGLWNKAKDLGVSVGSVTAAIEWFWDELHQGEYAAVLNALQSNMSIREMSDIFMYRFERPYDQSESACARRAALCQEMYDLYADVDPQEQDDDLHEIYWPPRMVCINMTGPDIDALQGLLMAHGYTIADERGVFGGSTDEAVRLYQRNNGLAADGIAGPLTWASLIRI